MLRPNGSNGRYCTKHFKVLKATGIAKFHVQVTKITTSPSMFLKFWGEMADEQFFSYKSQIYESNLPNFKQM